MMDAVVALDGMVMFMVFGVLFGLLRVALVGRDKITLKKDAALEYYNCLRDDQVEVVARAKARAVKWHLAPLSRFLGRLVEAYADIRAMRRGEETPLPPVSTVKGEQKKKL